MRSFLILTSIALIVVVVGFLYSAIASRRLKRKYEKDE